MNAINHVDEGLKQKILELLPSHSTVEGLRETEELQGVPKDEIYAALHLLQGEGKVTTGDLLGRTRPKRLKQGT